MARARQYGLLDGEISYFYAMNFALLRKSIAPGSVQQAALVAVRNTIYGVLPTGAYFFFTPIPTPTVENTDFLFFPSATLTRRRQVAAASASASFAAATGSAEGADGRRRLRGHVSSGANRLF
jgi:hypothetical protein